MFILVIMSSKKGKKGAKKVGGGEPVSFSQKEMQEFKEAFGIMDANKDGVIDKNDLKSVFAQLGQIPPDSQLDEMISEAPGPIDFAMFLTLFGERLTGTDPEDTIVGAFQMFDPKETGFVTEDHLRKILSHKKGEPFDDEEFDNMYKGKPPIADGKVDYKAFAHLICTGAQEEMNN